MPFEDRSPVFLPGLVQSSPVRDGGFVASWLVSSRPQSIGTMWTFSQLMLAVIGESPLIGSWHTSLSVFFFSPVAQDTMRRMSQPGNRCTSPAIGTSCPLNLLNLFFPWTTMRDNHHTAAAAPADDWESRGRPGRVSIATVSTLLERLRYVIPPHHGGPPPLEARREVKAWTASWEVCTQKGFSSLPLGHSGSIGVAAAVGDNVVGSG